MIGGLSQRSPIHHDHSLHLCWHRSDFYLFICKDDCFFSHVLFQSVLLRHLWIKLLSAKVRAISGLRLHILL